MANELIEFVLVSIALLGIGIYGLSVKIITENFGLEGKKFSRKALKLKSNIYHDIKSTLKMFRNINNEM